MTIGIEETPHHCIGRRGDHEFCCCARTPQRHFLKEQGSRKSHRTHTSEWKMTRPKYLPGINLLLCTKSGILGGQTGVLLLFTSFSFPLLYSTLWTSFLSHLPLLFTHTCLLQYLLLHSPRSHVQSTQPCTVLAQSTRSHAQSTRSHAQSTRSHAQSTRSHAQFISLSI